MNRRGFLKFLAVAPVAVPVVASAMPTAPVIITTRNAFFEGERGPEMFFRQPGITTGYFRVDYGSDVFDPRDGDVANDDGNQFEIQVTDDRQQHPLPSD